MSRTTATGPLVYSCSGSSNVAQLANHIAVRLDRLGLAEMSCIAGVGGNVKPLVRKATSGRPIVVIDGCPLSCKRQHVDFDSGEREAAFDALVEELAPVLDSAAARAGGS